MITTSIITIIMIIMVIMIIFEKMVIMIMMIMMISLRATSYVRRAWTRSALRTTSWVVCSEQLRLPMTKMIIIIIMIINSHYDDCD